MRKRIKLNAICSSENYRISKRIHIQFIKNEHIRNIEMLSEINACIPNKKIAYTKIFGVEYRLTESEIEKYPTLKIYYK